MEDSTRLKLIVLGLVLAAIAGAYLFFSGRFLSRNNQPSPTPEFTDSPIVLASPSAPVIVIPPQQPPLRGDVPPLPPTGASDVNTLPATGLPMELLGSLGAAGIAIGYALRRFPK